jgi:uncharacterized protein YacL
MSEKSVRLRNIVPKFFLYLGIAGAGAITTASQRPIVWMESGQTVQPLWANLLAGVVGGLFVASVLEWVSRSVKRRVGAGEGVAILNGSIVGLIGALFGLLGYMVLELLFQRSLWLQLIEAGVIFFFTYLGFIIGFNRENLLLSLVGGERSGASTKRSTKLLDTSVIIDGRISDLVKTGFIEGQIVVPQFVMDELQSIADSADGLRRRRGRRGLDILGDLRTQLNSNFQILERDYPSHHAVDRKLIQLAKELSAKIITTDFNLNKVAKVEGISVLNINELANSVKPRFIQGEDLEVEVISPGEESDQGIGYLDDGTMVVVENGRPYIGKKILVTVSNVLQKEAGKMLFVRPKGEVNGN